MHNIGSHFKIKKIGKKMKKIKISKEEDTIH